MIKVQPARTKRVDTCLLALLGLFVGLPPMVVFFGVKDGAWIFILYREPKLAAIMILGWILLAAMAWVLGGRITSYSLTSVVSTPPMLLLGAFIVYLGLTGLWALVPANAAYEMRQYLLIYLLLIFLVWWNRTDARVGRVVGWSLVASIGVLTVIGLGQATGLLEFLVPIDPYEMVRHPSLLGYKNPMAMAVLGQLFILAGMAFRSAVVGRKRAAAALGTLAAVELIYLVTLQSRASLLGLAGGTCCLVVLLLARGGSVRRGAVASALVAALVGVVLTVSVLSPRVGERVRSAVAYAVDPSSFLDSDRGTYLVNTVNMVRHNPPGVGVGDWQTHYPVYRTHNRYLAYNEDYQVRRAHSDLVQILGEAGWPGLVLWIGFLVVLLARVARGWVRVGCGESLFVAAQLVALVGAMSLDYVLEHPYGKFQFFLVVFLGLAGGSRLEEAPPGSPLPAGVRRILAASLTVVAMLNTAYFVGFARKIVVSGHLNRTYLHAVPSQDPSRGPNVAPGADPEGLLQVVDLGRIFVTTPGHTKAMFRDHLLIADSYHRLGRGSPAVSHLVRSLELHPHHPMSFRLMARLQLDGGARRQWESSADYIMDEASDGFQRAYPPGHPLAADR